MKLLCFEEWLETFGMGELLVEKEDSIWTDEEENDWLSDAYEEYVGYAEDIAYDEYKEKDI